MVELQPPTHGPQPLEQLEVFADGRKCNTCGYIVRTDERIQRHCRLQYGWINPWKRGPKREDRQRAGLALSRPWTESVHCQRFFTHGRRQEYFEVQAPRGSSEAPEQVATKWEQARLQLT